jgi:hypothetical protein
VNSSAAKLSSSAVSDDARTSKSSSIPLTTSSFAQRALVVIDAGGSAGKTDARMHADAADRPNCMSATPGELLILPDERAGADPPMTDAREVNVHG